MSIESTSYDDKGLNYEYIIHNKALLGSKEALKQIYEEHHLNLGQEVCYVYI